jgi:coenzyme F420-reducing hydrogenase beta subunit
MSVKNISLVTENNLCTGCGACKVACPPKSKSISIEKTEIGSLFAKINVDTCISCGICLDVCPGYDLKNNVLIAGTDPFEGKIKNTYTGISTNPVIYENAQSGGLVTECLSYLFDTGQISAAVVCVSDYGQDRPVVSAVIITDKQQLSASQRSQYTPVDMVSALDGTGNYDRVAFVGLPCHIQGVMVLQKNFKRFQNIVYKFGLICDRSLSEANTDVFLKIYWKKKTYWKKKIYWRNKTLYHNYKTAPVIIESENGIQRNVPAFLRHLLKDYFTSPRCRICFDKINIHADIVFGDPWGMSNIDWKNGESLVITRTDAGESLILNLIKERRALLNKASFAEVRKGQHLNVKKSQIKTYFEIFKNNNWLLPCYADNLNLSETPLLQYDKCARMVSDYVKLGTKHRSEIVKEVQKKLQMKIIKHKIAGIFRTPFRILKTIKNIMK